MTSAAFEDVPVIGGLLSSTIGRLIKPAKLMHVNEWARTNPDTGEVSEEKPLGCFQEKWVADLCRDFLADNDHEPNNDYFIHEL
jgi:hypothetical protein